MRVTSIAVSEVGKVRAHNEDAVFADDELGLWLVADGMGGHAAGEVASRLAVATVVEEVKAGSELKDAVKRAHSVIKVAARENREQAGMGTTIVALRRCQNRFTLVWSGDSRAYGWSCSEAFSQLTTDHSFVGDMVARGILTVQEAEDHPDRHLISQALGISSIPHLRPEEMEFRPRRHGGVLLCSDGVSDMLGAARLAEICGGGGDLQETSARLTRAIENTPASDNYSFVLLDYQLAGVAQRFCRWWRG
ncbi:protein phosphatase PrpC [Microbulbifer aestuariivivens]|uniref:Protein phosphatase PrpC n=1 Tax=Microbulbifer aestuariivivens TaxID=1908308 RepID=A0ABP9WTH2_9GAMM